MILHPHWITFLLFHKQSRRLVAFVRKEHLPYPFQDFLRLAENVVIKIPPCSH